MCPRSTCCSARRCGPTCSRASIGFQTTHDDAGSEPTRRQTPIVHPVRPQGPRGPACRSLAAFDTVRPARLREQYEIEEEPPCCRLNACRTPSPARCWASRISACRRCFGRSGRPDPAAAHLPEQHAGLADRDADGGFPGHRAPGRRALLPLRGERVHPLAIRRASLAWCAMASTSRHFLQDLRGACRNAFRRRDGHGWNGRSPKRWTPRRCRRRPIGTLDGDDAAATPELVLQPSLRFVISHWPVMSIWSAHQAGGDIEKHRAVGPARPSASRFGAAATTSALRCSTSAQFSFRYSLKAGLGLDKAVARALTHEPMFDLVGALVSLFGDGLVTGIRTNPNHSTDGDIR